MAFTDDEARELLLRLIIRQNGGRQIPENFVDPMMGVLDEIIAQYRKDAKAAEERKAAEEKKQNG